jgi:hypothetical protein
LLPDLEDEQRRHDERRVRRDLEIVGKGRFPEGAQPVPDASLRRALKAHVANPAEVILPTVEAE